MQQILIVNALKDKFLFKERHVELILSNFFINDPIVLICYKHSSLTTRIGKCVKTRLVGLPLVLVIFCVLSIVGS